MDWYIDSVIYSFERVEQWSVVGGEGCSGLERGSMVWGGGGGEQWFVGGGREQWSGGCRRGDQ